jgi:hypothetical protein
VKEREKEKGEEASKRRTGLWKEEGGVCLGN